MEHKRLVLVPAAQVRVKRERDKGDSGGSPKKLKPDPASLQRGGGGGDGDEESFANMLCGTANSALFGRSARPFALHRLAAETFHKDFTAQVTDYKSSNKRFEYDADNKMPKAIVLHEGFEGYREGDMITDIASIEQHDRSDLRSQDIASLSRVAYSASVVNANGKPASFGVEDMLQLFLGLRKPEYGPPCIPHNVIFARKQQLDHISVKKYQHAQMILYGIASSVKITGVYSTPTMLDIGRTLVNRLNEIRCFTHKDNPLHIDEKSSR